MLFSIKAELLLQFVHGGAHLVKLVVALAELFLQLIALLVLLLYLGVLGRELLARYLQLLFLRVNPDLLTVHLRLELLILAALMLQFALMGQELLHRILPFL